MARLLFSGLAKAASFTARGMAVTLSSTVLSCYCACKIEQGANRLIYRYFPEKFANVEYASGITEDELDLVRRRYGVAVPLIDTVKDKDPTEMVTSIMEMAAEQDSALRQQQEQHLTTVEEETKFQAKPSIGNKTSRQQFTANKTRFWREEETSTTTKTATSLFLPTPLPNQEILACAMTG